MSDGFVYRVNNPRLKRYCHLVEILEKSPQKNYFAVIRCPVWKVRFIDGKTFWIRKDNLEYVGRGIK